MGRAIGLGLIIVVTYAIIRWTSPGAYWVEFALLMAVVVGIGAVVAHGSGERRFLTAAAASFMTVLCVLCLEFAALYAAPPWGQPAVLPPPGTMILGLVTLSLLCGAASGAVALGLRSLWARPSR